MLTANDIRKLFEQPHGPQTPGAVFVSGALETNVLTALRAEGLEAFAQSGGQYVVNPAALKAQAEASDKIYKYPLTFGLGGIHRFCLPEPSGVVHVGMQDGTVQLWVRVGQGDPRPRFFQVVATGQPFPTSARYVGTVQSGGYVWHVLERTDIVSVEVRDSPPAD